MKRSNLSVQIEGINKLNKMALDITNKLEPVLDTLIGKKIAKADNSLSKKGEILKAITNEYGRTYINIGDNDIWLQYGLCLTGGSYDDNSYYCQYFDSSIRLGDMENKTLIKTEINKNGYDETITEEEQKRLIAEYLEAKEKADKIKRLIHWRIKDSEYIK